MIPPQILIIDDDPYEQRVYQDFLRIHGFEIKRVSAESEALAILADRDFEGIIIDLKKNQPSIIDLTLKCKTANPLSCIILMISDPTASFIKNALNNGAEVCLIKPILPVMLLESIKKGIALRICQLALKINPPICLLSNTRQPKDREALKPTGRDHSRSGNTAGSDRLLSTRFLR